MATRDPAPVISPTIELCQSRLRPREWGTGFRESCGLTIDHLGPHVLLLFPTSLRLCTVVERTRRAVLIHVSDQFDLPKA